MQAVGSIVSAGTAIYSANKQKKASKSAANDIAKAADSAVVTSTQNQAAQQTVTQAEARDATQLANRRRMTVASTVNNVSPLGLRKTLG